MQLKKLKEYHKRADGTGMQVTDQLMKVMEHEIGTLQYLNQHMNISNVCRLHGIFESEEKIILVLDYCEGGQILTWHPKLLEFRTALPISDAIIRSWMRSICEGLR